MILFLTSSPDGDLGSENEGCPYGFDNRNGFADHLRQALPEPAFFTAFAADPDAYDSNDQAVQYFAGVFERTGIPLTGFAVCDGRNAEQAGELLSRSGVIMLCGGHVPTEHAFFEAIGLRELLQAYDGVVISISAGSMNCACEVYAQPEEPGEAVDPAFDKFLPGLGLTDIQILPHYQIVKDVILDGLKLLEEVTARDSMGHCFFALPDGSYFLIDRDGTFLFGEAYTLCEGEFSQISQEGDVLQMEE